MKNSNSNSLEPKLQIELESLFVNNPSLAQIHTHLAKFNPIKVMGMSHMEIRHSKILGWLLNPRENHGLDDKFLKAFLTQAMQGASDPPNSLNIQVRKLSESSVSLEWNNIDIFIEVPHEKNEWCFVIENKVYSSQGKNQLKDYRTFVESRFPKHSKGYIFLTLNHEEPNDDHYQQIFYSDIVEILDSILQESKDTLSSRIYNFINYYKETIMELSEMSEEQDNAKKLARKLYREHKRALDFIYEHAGSHEFEYGTRLFLKKESGTVDKNDTFSTESSSYTIAAVSGSWFSFVSDFWLTSFIDANPHEGDVWLGCEKWKGQGIPLKAWVEIVDKSNADKESYHLRLVAEVGPIKDVDTRQQLVESLDEASRDISEIKFYAKSRKAGVKYSRFLSLSKRLNDHFDAQEIAKKISNLMSEFEKHIPIINKGVAEFCRKISQENKSAENL